MMKKFPFLCKAVETSTCRPWPPSPSCINTPSTASFRASASSDDEIPDKDEEAAVIQGLMSDRLFFEPGRTNSILDYEAKLPDDGGVAVVELDSRNPFRDFKASMAEMVEAYGLREDWGCLEELLEWYLQVNREHNHAYIIGAFVDLVLQIEPGNNDDDDRAAMNPAAVDEERAASSASSSTAPCSFTFSSSNYSSTTHCLSVLETEDDDDGNIVEHRPRHGSIHVI